MSRRQAMNSEIRKMAESLQSDLIDFCARLIETRSDSGDEEKIAGLYGFSAMPEEIFE